MTLRLRSPSLRGSGLKLTGIKKEVSSGASPSLRGSGLKSLHKRLKWDGLCRSPSLRGSGSKWEAEYNGNHFTESPSLRGSGLKSTYLAFGNQMARVSLFTREWIEIRVLVRINIPCDRSPSLRGSGLKLSANQHLSNQVLSPSLRGSGLKFFCL